MTVYRRDPNKSRKFCVDGVILKDKPFFANRICRIDLYVLYKLKPETKIIVSGRGNWMGIIPEKIRIAAPN